MQSHRYELQATSFSYFNDVKSPKITTYSINQKSRNYFIEKLSGRISMKKHEKDFVSLDINGYELHTTKKKPPSKFGSISSAVLYGLCSFSMAFANKTVISVYKFNFPFFIMACQMILTIIFLESLKSFRVTNIPKYSLKLGLSFAWPAFFYALHSVTALYALSGMSIPMYAAVKRCAPIITLILSVIILKKHLPSYRIVTSVFLISVGCILAGLGDLQFDLQAYAYGTFSVLVQALYLTLSQKHLENSTALNILYLNSYNTVPLYIFLCLFSESVEILKYGKFTDYGFLLCLGIQTSMGVLLNYSLFLCTAKNSALTTSLVGVIKSILQTVIGFFTFGGVKFNPLNVFGITLNLFGGILYSYSKYVEKT
nr:UDP-galactose/UDP-glucose transporter 7 isoform X1 [Parasteatoda tepidariorum]